MTEQEWEDIQAEELQQNVDEFSEYLLDEGLAINKDERVLDLKNTKKVWRGEYGLHLIKAAEAWDQAFQIRDS